MHKRMNFFGSNFVFTFLWLVVPNYSGKFFFHWTQMREATIISAYTQCKRKEVFPATATATLNSNMTPLNFVKIVFRNFFLLNAPEVVFLPIFKIKYII